MSDDLFATVESAAKRLGVAIGWIYLLIRCGDLPAKKSGRRWVVPVVAIEERRRARKPIDRTAGHLQTGTAAAAQPKGRRR